MKTNLFGNILRYINVVIWPPDFFIYRFICTCDSSAIKTKFLMYPYKVCGVKIRLEM